MKRPHKNGSVREDAMTTAAALSAYSRTVERAERFARHLDEVEAFEEDMQAVRVLHREIGRLLRRRVSGPTVERIAAISRVFAMHVDGMDSALSWAPEAADEGEVN